MQRIRELTDESHKSSKKITVIGFLFMVYISVWICTNNQIFLYAGYGVVCGCALIKSAFSGEKGTIMVPIPARNLFFFSMFCWCSVFWAWNTKYAIDKNIFIFVCVIMVIIMSNYFIKQKSVDVVLYTIAVMGIAMAIYVIVKEGGYTAFYNKATASVQGGNYNANRIGGEITNLNTIGMTCSYSAIVLFYYALFKRKYLCYLIMLIPLLGSAGSGSRKSLVLAFLGILFLFYFFQKDKKKYPKVS